MIATRLDLLSWEFEGSDATIPDVLHAKPGLAVASHYIGTMGLGLGVSALMAFLWAIGQSPLWLVWFCLGLTGVCVVYLLFGHKQRFTILRDDANGIARVFIKGLLSRKHTVPLGQSTLSIRLKEAYETQGAGEHSQRVHSGYNWIIRIDGPWCAELTVDQSNSLARPGQVTPHVQQWIERLAHVLDAQLPVG